MGICYFFLCLWIQQKSKYDWNLIDPTMILKSQQGFTSMLSTVVEPVQ